eukprot:CAMPEP_0194307374 /NCGR_PEP_ID=MMETSP0171-20130528/4277_1 /TAXON_ID=218684 /ORGANISM="Corethron pennatum, Strain L29A3" /LENGTH=63 /DNA_ID=CAMNT_0039059423 /DNA_START=115 /DNA_END=306 /DNA_ORIENTATION=-
MSPPSFFSKAANVAQRATVVGLVGSAVYGVFVVKTQLSELGEMSRAGRDDGNQNAPIASESAK